MKYMIIQADNIHILASKVDSVMKEGWIPQGGVAAVSETYTIYYIQAMILIDEDNNNVCRL